MNRTEFIAQVRAHQGGLRRFLMALTGGDRMLSDDLSQDALLKAYLSLDSFVARCKFSTWIYGIAYRCFLDYVRFQKRHPRALWEEAMDLAADPSPQQADRYGELYRALDGLPQSERTAILLSYMEERPIHEIALIMDMPEGTVKSHLSRGRKHLRERLSNER